MTPRGFLRGGVTGASDRRGKARGRGVRSAQATRGPRETNGDGMTGRADAGGAWQSACCCAAVTMSVEAERARDFLRLFPVGISRPAAGKSTITTPVNTGGLVHFIRHSQVLSKQCGRRIRMRRVW